MFRQKHQLVPKMLPLAAKGVGKKTWVPTRGKEGEEHKEKRRSLLSNAACILMSGGVVIWLPYLYI